MTSWRREGKVGEQDEPVLRLLRRSPKGGRSIGNLVSNLVVRLETPRKKAGGRKSSPGKRSSTGRRRSLTVLLLLLSLLRRRSTVGLLLLTSLRSSSSCSLSSLSGGHLASES